MGGATPSHSYAQERGHFGWLEKVKLYPGAVMVHAKLDTGADYSSLDSAAMEEFERDGKKWVRFEVISRFGQKENIERPVVRSAWVKKRNGNHSKRNVVRLGICLGKTYMEADVNLVDRSNFTQPMLIGRNFLAGNALVDASSSYTVEPDCKGVALP